MLLSYRLCSSGVFLLLITLVGTVSDVGQANSYPSNSIAGDGSVKIMTNVFADDDKLHPITSETERRNRYTIVNDEWNSGSLTLDRQLNKSSAMLSSSNTNITSPGDLNVLWPYFYTGCLWLPINHVSFQLAHVFLCLSYLAPPTLYGLIYLRLVLAIGSAFLASWACFVICAFDTFLWNSLFLLINAVHAVVLIFSLRTVKLGPQIEEVYQHFFKPLKVSKQQFKIVAECMKSIRLMARGEYFAIEKETKVETLSLLLCGSMSVFENNRTLHSLHPMQFLDSAEWFGISPVSPDDFYQTSIQACEESRVLLWHRDKLLSILQKDPFLQSVFSRILGLDLVQKLCQMREKIASQSGERTLPFKTINLLNNVLFVESEKPSLSSTFNPQNLKMKFSKKIRKPIQMKTNVSPCVSANSTAPIIQ